MRFSSPQSSAKTTRLAVETLEHKMLLAADVLASGSVLDNSPINDTAKTESSESNLVVFPGDANRDGVFNQQDLVQLFLAEKYLTGESADWSEGDWNGDNVFDQLDLVTALQVGSYTPQSQNAEGEGPPNEGNQSILTLLAAEEAARIAADAAIEGDIAAEEAARIAADAVLADAIAAEESSRTSADMQLADDVAGEEAARMSADAGLADAIAAEEAARLAADATIASNLDVEEAARLAADTALAADLDAEEAARIAADADLLAQIPSQLSLSLVVDSDSADVAPGDIKSLFATCPADTLLVGGGFDGPGLRITVNRINGNDGWVATADNSSPVSHVFEVNAYCLAVS